MLYILAVLAAGILWGTMGSFVRSLTAAGFTSLQIVAFRCFVTFLVVGLIILARDRKAFKIRLRDLWCFFGSGVVSILFFTFCYFTAITLTDLSVAAILLYTAPIFVMLISLAVFGERLTKVKVLALLLAFGGCLLVSGFGGAVSFKGLLVGLGSGLGYALYSIFSSLATRKGYGPFTVTFYTFAFAAAGCLAIADLPGMAALFAAKPALMGNAVLLGVATAVFPYLLYNWGLTGMEASKAAIIASIEPVTATILGAAVFGEAITPVSGTGIALVLAAIVLLTLGTRKPLPTGGI